MLNRLESSSALPQKTLSAYEYIFTREMRDEARVDLEHIRLQLPTAAEARSADLASIHMAADWDETLYLREFFHKNHGMLQQIRRVIRRLMQTHDRIMAVTELLPDKLGMDSYILEQCCRRDDKSVDPDRGIYPSRLLKMSEAFVTAGYIIPETNRLLADHPADALALAEEALQWSSEQQRRAQPLIQVVTRYLIEKLMREGHLHHPRSIQSPIQDI